jgi:hypothetical protein
MANIEINDETLYPHEDALLVPLVVDVERYYQKFLANSARLFANEGQVVEIVRILARPRAEG